MKNRSRRKKLKAKIWGTDCKWFTPKKRKQISCKTFVAFFLPTRHHSFPVPEGCIRKMLLNWFHLCLSFMIFLKQFLSDVFVSSLLIWYGLFLNPSYEFSPGEQECLPVQQSEVQVVTLWSSSCEVYGRYFCTEQV